MVHRHNQQEDWFYTSHIIPTPGEAGKHPQGLIHNSLRADNRRLEFTNFSQTIIINEQKQLTVKLSKNHLELHKHFIHFYIIPRFITTSLTFYSFLYYSKNQ